MLYLKKMLQSMRIIGLLKDLISNWLLMLHWMANSRRWGLSSCQIPRGGDEKRGQMPHPPSTRHNVSLLIKGYR